MSNDDEFDNIQALIDEWIMTVQYTGDAGNDDAKNLKDALQSQDEEDD